MADRVTVKVHFDVTPAVAQLRAIADALNTAAGRLEANTDTDTEPAPDQAAANLARLIDELRALHTVDRADWREHIAQLTDRYDPEPAF